MAWKSWHEDVAKVALTSQTAPTPHPYLLVLSLEVAAWARSRGNPAHPHHHELNRALLARQLLLERGRMPIPRALERIGGLQSQYAPSAYIGLWSRLDGFARDDLTRGLERRQVVQATLMRVTIHMVSAADYWPMTEGIRKHRRAQWLAARKQFDAKQMAAAAKKAAKELAGEPLSRAELKKLGHTDASAWNGVGMWLDLVRVPPSGTWERRRADIYGLAEEWVPPARTVTEDEGRELLLRRYSRASGPRRRPTPPTGRGFRPRRLPRWPSG